MQAGGICHTDIEVLHGNCGTSAFPVVPCHEYPGTIAEVGPGVSGHSVGDRVVVDPNLECGTCRACRRGWAHLCESLGFTPVGSGSADPERMRHAIDLVVEATGVPSVAARLIEHVGNGGTGHFFGVSPSNARIEIAPLEVFRRQLTLVGSRSLNHSIPEALEVIRSYGPGIGRLVSHRLPLEEIAVVLQGKAPPGSLKVQSCVG